MHCTERSRPSSAVPAQAARPGRVLAWFGVLAPVLFGLLACTGPSETPPSASQSAPPLTAAAAGASTAAAPAPAAQSPAAVIPSAPAAQPARPGAAASPKPPIWPLAAPQAARSWDAFQQQAARRLVAANPGRVYLGLVPDPLLAIPVLEVELTADGQVRRIKVLRVPTQATDTVQLAKDAVYRAAPYGSMKHLSKPWTFVEVFLFDDERRFKPRTLDD